MGRSSIASVPFWWFSVPATAHRQPLVRSTLLRCTAPFQLLTFCHQLASPPIDYKNVKMSVYIFCIIENFHRPYTFAIFRKSPPRASHGLLSWRYLCTPLHACDRIQKRPTAASIFGPYSRFHLYRFNSKMDAMPTKTQKATRFGWLFRYL